MNPFSHLKAGFSKTFRPSGRMGRAAFWRFLFSLLLTLVLLGYLDLILFGTLGVYVDMDFWAIGPLANVFGVFGLFALTSAAIRRLHDQGRSAWLGLLPPLVALPIMAFGAFFFMHIRSFAGLGYFHLNLLLGYALAALTLLALVWLLARPGQLGPNRFGPDPHEVSE